MRPTDDPRMDLMRGISGAEKLAFSQEDCQKIAAPAALNLK
jgi:hypothetical protein